jgi:ubiquinone/menaquinone biosynthesis C-methylase UbiE
MTVELSGSIEIVCPICKFPLLQEDDVISCINCGRKYVQASVKFINLVPEDKFRGNSFKKWQSRQRIFIGWSKNIMNEAIAYDSKNLYDEFAEYIGSIKGLTLDVGCADGQMNNYLKTTKYIGIDPYEGWVLDERPEFMEKLYPVDKKNIIFVKGFGEYLPFGDCILDNVIISNALDHSSSLCLMLNEAKRVLKLGGGLYLMQENISLINKIKGKNLSGLYQMVKRRLMQGFLIGSFCSPHIKVNKEYIDKWLSGYFDFTSKLSHTSSHIMYRALKKT